VNRWNTPLGDFDLNVGEFGVSSVTRPGSDVFPPVDDDLAHALSEHLHGRPGSLQLNLQGLLPMAQHTLAKLLEIPHGEVRTHSWLAREIGRPAAAQPVASVVAQNPIPLLIPCHRVIRDDGALGDFVLGDSAMKRRVLEFEGTDVAMLEHLAGENIRFLGDKETMAFHLPSCRKGPTPRSGVGVEFTDSDAAAAQHYEPCRRCRPI
jgi:O-6-methylguanine DNA methyltransferase